MPSCESLKTINLSRKNNSRQTQLIETEKAGVAEPGQAYKGLNARDSRSRYRLMGYPVPKGYVGSNPTPRTKFAQNLYNERATPLSCPRT